MHHYSKNIEKLQRYCFSPQTHCDNSYISDFEKHKKYRGIAILLANAELATPELNREIVKSLLQGNLGWPKKDGSVGKIKTAIEIEVFENLGTISFFADYCSVHPRIYNVPEKKIKCESLKDFYTTLKMIQNIKYGAEGFIEPHFQISKNLASALLQKHSINLNLDDLPEIICQENKYAIKLNHNGRTNLLNEYLWQEINKSDDSSGLISDRDSYDNTPAALFKKWLLISRVYSECYLWSLNLDYIDERGKSLFLERLMDLIERDPYFNRTQNTLENQWLCESHFEEMFVQTSSVYKITIDLSGESETQIDDSNPAFSDLDKIKDKFINQKYECPISNIEFVHEWDYFKERQFPTSGFSSGYGILQKLVENDIHINGASINSYGRLDKLLSHCVEMPEIRHILFNLLPVIPSNENVKLNYCIHSRGIHLYSTH